MVGENSKKVNDKQKKTKRNLQKIELENLLEPLTINVFNLKKKNFRITFKKKKS